MKTLKKSNTLILAVLFMLANSCSNPSSNDSSENKNVEVGSSEIEAISSLENTYWKLVKIDGQDLVKDKNMAKEIHFKLNSNQKRVTGFSGCNSFFGVYKLKDGMRLNFNQLGSTQMACPDSKINEQEILNIFGLTDNYTINGNILSLNVGKRGPLAVFESTKEQ